mmetsp:Transcript_157988/g.291288  ORF Transcript_157988/g.291288 Transcript_157988/m.291288 type:complete len:238 (-) Transcript_157988:60-773(-)
MNCFHTFFAYSAVLLVLAAAETQECSEELNGLNEPELDEPDGMQVNLLQTYLESTQHRIAPANATAESVQHPTVRTVKPTLNGSEVVADKVSQVGNTSHPSIVADSAATFSLPQLLYHEIELELGTEGAALPWKNKIVLALLEGLMAPALCGIDRCYMGQPCLGILKGFTFGGFLIWYIIDYAYICVNMFKQLDTINAIGFRATFAADQVKPAMIIMVVFIAIKLFSVVYYSRSPKK